MIKKTKIEQEKIKCLGKCKKEKSPSHSNFYNNTHEIFSSCEKFPVCKDCITEYIGKKDTNFMNRVHMMLSLLDRPFIPERWEGTEENWSKYVTQISSLPQYKGKTYKDSIFENKIITYPIAEDIAEEDSMYTSEEIKKLKMLWGKKLEVEDLEYLEDEYGKFINFYESDSYTTQLLFQEAAQQRLAIKKLREEGKSVDKELKTLQDLLGSANVKPVQETGANATEQATFGTLVKKYENERPIPEPDPIWEDVDGVKKYIMVWFFGHLCKMLGINNEYSRMYEEEVSKYTVENPTYEESEEDGSDFK